MQNQLLKILNGRQGHTGASYSSELQQCLADEIFRVKEWYKGVSCLAGGHGFKSHWAGYQLGSYCLSQNRFASFISP
jgi:hypothetical protein